MVLQVGHTLKARHKDALEYHHLMSPDSQVFDIFHAMIKAKAFDIIDAGRKAGEIPSLCCFLPFISVTFAFMPESSSLRKNCLAGIVLNVGGVHHSRALAEDRPSVAHPV